MPCTDSKTVVPPTEVTFGRVEGKLPAGGESIPHIIAPLSPLAMKCDMPWATDRSWMLAYSERCPGHVAFHRQRRQRRVHVWYGLPSRGQLPFDPPERDLGRRDHRLRVGAGHLFQRGGVGRTDR